MCEKNTILDSDARKTNMPYMNYDSNIAFTSTFLAKVNVMQKKSLETFSGLIVLLQPGAERNPEVYNTIQIKLG